MTLGRAGSVGQALQVQGRNNVFALTPALVIKLIELDHFYASSQHNCTVFFG